jgi:hypothetical protein
MYTIYEVAFVFHLSTQLLPLLFLALYLIACLFHLRFDFLVFLVQLLELPGKLRILSDDLLQRLGLLVREG